MNQPKKKKCYTCRKSRLATSFSYYSSGTLRTNCKKCRRRASKLQGLVFHKYYPVEQRIVYSLLDGEGKIVYIGESYQGPYRIYTHLCGHSHLCRRGIDTSKWSYKVLWTGESHAKRIREEKRLINLHKPKHNH